MRYEIENELQELKERLATILGGLARKDLNIEDTMYERGRIAELKQRITSLTNRISSE